MKRKILWALLPVVMLLTMAQLFGPPIFAPFLTVGAGTRATSGLRVNDDATITGALTVGSCSGCTGGSLSQSEDTFEVTWEDACSSTETQTWEYNLTGDVVVLKMVDAVSCTGDSTFFRDSGTDLPSAIRPAQTVNIMGISTGNNGSNAQACLRLYATGQVALLNASSTSAHECVGLGTGGWTASGTRAIYNEANSGQTMFVYTIQ